MALNTKFNLRRKKIKQNIIKNKKNISENR